MRIPLKESFNFNSAVTSHGWWMLSPNLWNEQSDTFCRPIQLNTGKNVIVSIVNSDNHLEVTVENTTALNEDERAEIIKQVSWIFRLEENFDALYTLSEELSELTHLSTERMGRLLRSPTLFEDVVKVILTTNTRWQQTINMTENLVKGLGESVMTHQQQEFKTFPTPEKVLEAGEDYLKEHVRVGYRSAYIMDVASKALDESFNLEAFKTGKRDLNELKTIKGVGPYAYNTLAMLLGKYNSLPVDSEYKKHVTSKYFNGEQPSQKELESVYDKWGEYKFLAYWFDN